LNSLCFALVNQFVGLIVQSSAFLTIRQSHLDFYSAFSKTISKIRANNYFPMLQL